MSNLRRHIYKNGIYVSVCQFKFPGEQTPRWSQKYRYKSFLGGSPMKDKGRGTRSRQEKSLDGNAGLTQVKGEKKGRMFV